MDWIMSEYWQSIVIYRVIVLSNIRLVPHQGLLLKIVWFKGFFFYFDDLSLRIFRFRSALSF